MEAAKKVLTSSCSSFVETLLLCPVSSPNCIFALKRKKQLSLLPTWVSNKKIEMAPSHREEIRNFTTAVVNQTLGRSGTCSQGRDSKAEQDTGHRKEEKAPISDVR